MQNKITGIIGPKGSGKSFHCARLMCTMERAAVYQIVREDSAYLICSDQIFDGGMVAFCEAIGEEKFRVIYMPPEGSSYVDGERLVYPDFELFVRACFHRRDMTMIIDEAHFVCTSRSCPEFLWESVITGRHKELDIIYCTQRFAMIARDITANTDEFYFWQIIEPLDLKGISDRCGSEVAADVSELRRTEDLRRKGGEITPGQMLHWTAWQGVVEVTK